MSAFIVSKRTLTNVAAFIYNVASGKQGISSEMTVNAFGGKTLQEIAQEIYKTNVQSVNHRYSERSSTKLTEEINVNTDDYLITEDNKAFGFQILKSLRCWDYQSCESSTSRNSKSYKCIESLIDALTEYLGYKVSDENEYTKTEEYSQAYWD